MDVFLVWHVRHARNLDGSPTEHRDEAGELAYDEEFDDLKIIGVYEDEAAAEAAIARTRQLPGFKDEPDCFMVDGYALGEDHWTEGFVSGPRDPY
ncbi:hypothetical protein [Intrasporangium sp. YIM S08009]|uniref:DUF7336 domain-containing protein n=1 Tax=Intrasporangium zincisolvens TaxID=3080018 RepID=UPI002B0615B7|nr:hypothetical protein [Intrasporangium sp. YIM S08009]